MSLDATIGLIVVSILVGAILAWLVESLDFTGWWP